MFINLVDIIKSKNKSTSLSSRQKVHSESRKNVVFVYQRGTSSKKYKSETTVKPFAWDSSVLPVCTKLAATNTAAKHTIAALPRTPTGSDCAPAKPQAEWETDSTLPLFRMSLSNGL